MVEEEGGVDMGKGDGDYKVTTDEVPQSSLRQRTGKGKGFIGGVRKVVRSSRDPGLQLPISL